VKTGMNKRFGAILTVIFCGLIFLTVTALTATEKPAEEPTEAPEEVVIENKGYKKDKKGPVTFQHKKHQEEYLNLDDKKIACTECHHKYEDEKNVWKEGDPVKKCGAEDCHDPLKKKGKKQHKLQIAFHKNCKDCHKAIVKAGKKKANEAPFKKCVNCMGKKGK
jgi:hypothetical protein